MSLTVTDLFCGAGGSSSGAVQIPDVEVTIAANHWKLAVEVHNANHPTTDHATADIHEADPHYFPKTDILWASPECTKWTQAGGKRVADLDPGLFEDPLADEAAQRSRMLMFDVPRFADVHRYRAILVENVVDIAMRPKYAHAFALWLKSMSNLGYDHRVISLNSMHAQAFGMPAAQSRDRLYVGFWRSGDTAPDFERFIRPAAWCGRCEKIIEARQAWKPGRTVGRYRQQYLYVCADCGTTVEPAWLPALSIIDWSMLGERIGDRTRPLKDKTRRRIAAGIARYWQPVHLEAAGHTYDAADPKHPSYGDPNAYYRAWPVEDALKTLHTLESKALAIPVEGRDGKQPSPMSDAMRTLTTRAETALVTPLIAELRGGGSTSRPVTEPAATFCANGNHHALVTPSGGSWNDDARPVTDPLRALTTREAYALLSPYYGNSQTAQSAGDPIGTLSTRDRYALITRHNSSRGDGAEMTTPAFEVLRTLTTRGHQSVITPGDMAAAEARVDDCMFRMLEPHEVAAGMAFPADYIWSGNRRERVKLAGNAVTPPAARDLIAAVAEALA